VVNPEVFDGNARLRNARRPARFEDEHRPAGKPFRNPALHRTSAQPRVLEFTKTLEIGEARDVPPRIPAARPRELQPERRARCRIEMPVDDLADPGVERLARRLHTSRTLRTSRTLQILHTVRRRGTRLRCL